MALIRVINRRDTKKKWKRKGKKKEMGTNINDIIFQLLSIITRFLFLLFVYYCPLFAKTYLSTSVKWTEITEKGKWRMIRNNIYEHSWKTYKNLLLHLLSLLIQCGSKEHHVFPAIKGGSFGFFSLRNCV